MKPTYATKAEAAIHRQPKTRLVEEVLDKLVQKEKTVSAERLVEVAQDTKHPLHRYFEWNDAVAGAKYRIAQATQMILATRFVVYLRQATEENFPRATAVEKPSRVRKLLSIGEHAFAPRTKVLQDAAARRSFIERKKTVLRGWCREVKDVEELDELRSAIEERL